MKEVSSIQVEKLMQIADYLREKRETMGVSLDEIAIKTFIPLRLLQALDNGQVERLPEAVFVQGFIRRYADALGLDGMALAKTFPVEPPPDVSNLAESESASVSEPAEELSEKQRIKVLVKPKLVPSRASGSGLSFPYVSLGVAAVFVLAIAAYSLSTRPKVATQLQSSQRETTSTDASSVPSNAQTQTTQSTSTSVSPTSSELLEQTTPSANNVSVEVAVDLKDGDSWVEVIVDGKTEFEGTLKKGAQKTWTAQKKLVLISGNAGAVYLSYNGNEQTKLGSLGEVKEIAFPPSENTLSRTN